MPETVVPGLERRLKAQLLGDVQFDAFTRGRYATDASHYQIMPIGVVAPSSTKEVEYTLALARSRWKWTRCRPNSVTASGVEVDCWTWQLMHGFATATVASKPDPLTKFDDFDGADPHRIATSGAAQHARSLPYYRQRVPSYHLDCAPTLGGA